MSVKASEIINIIQDFAPLKYQESYDNSGLLLGDSNTEINRALLTLDITEAVVEEAISAGCEMIIAHHPIIFSGIKSLTGKNYVERVLLKAIKNNILLFAAHTNLDNMREGVNHQIAQRLNLLETKLLQPANNTLRKLQTYVPHSCLEKVRNALFMAGGGALGNYSECSFNSSGTGTFRPGSAAHPAIGTPGGDREYIEETKIELIYPIDKESQIVAALLANHEYETVAYDIISLENVHSEIGAGLIGDLETAMSGHDFLQFLKTRMKTECIRHTELSGNLVQRVAVCGGAGSFLLNRAIAAKADVFVTADYKYHQFFDAEGKILIADIGHFESEQFTPELFQRIIAKKLPNFATLFSQTKTNPIKYFF